MANVEAKLNISVYLMLLTRFLVKSISVISTLILIRLLAPEDFGIIAIAMSIYAFIELFGQFGFNSALIQKQNTSQKDYDTVFTFNCFFGFIAGVTIYLFSSELAHFFNNPKLETVFQWLAIIFIIQGFFNVKVIRFQKEMNFKQELKLQVFPKFLSFFITIFLAWYFKDFHALLFGMVCAKLLNVSFSYAMAPNIPRFSLQGAKGLFGFSKWIMINNFLYFFNNKSIELIVGKYFSISMAGTYSISREMSSLPETEIAAPINKAAYPAYAKAQNNDQLLTSLFNKTIYLISLISLPASIGLLSVTELFVPVVLGKDWANAVPIIQLLALTSFFTSLTNNNNYIFMAKGKPHITSVISFIRMFSLLALIFILMEHYNETAPAMALFFTAVANCFVSYCILKIILNISFIKLFLSISRPLLSCAIMFTSIQLLKLYWSTLQNDNLLHFLVLVVAGITVYFSSIYCFWQYANKPDGPEASIFRKLKLA